MITKLSEVELDEVSLVDTGANPHAAIKLMKRDTETFDKENVVHSEGTGASMTEQEIAKLQSDLDAANAANAVAKAATERLETITKLSSEDRAAYDALTPADQDGFHKADATERTRLLATKKTGESVEKRMETIEKALAIAKQEAADAKAQAIAADAIAKTERDKRESVEFAKRAEDEFPNLPGTDVEKGLTLKAISRLAKEERDAIEKLLKCGNEALSQLGKGVGSARNGDVDNADALIEKKAKAKVAANPKLTIEKATEEVMTEEPALYDRYNKEKSRAN